MGNRARWMSWRAYSAAALCAVMAVSTAANTPPPRIFSTIQVVGNDRFRDGDILATSGLQTGVALSQSDLEQAYEALQFTGEFERVEIRSQGDVLIIEVDETPQYSGGLTFGLGYDTDIGVFGAGGLLIDGALGPGSQLRGDFLVGEEVQTLGLDLSSDTFWSPTLRGGVRFDVANFEYDTTTYQYQFAAVEPYLQFELNDRSRAELRYTLGQRRISDVDPSASTILQAEAGDRTSSGVGFTVRTGSAQFEDGFGAGSQWFFRFDQDFTGLGGDTTLSTSQATLAFRQRLAPSGLAVRVRVELGAVAGFDGDTPRVSERFTLGGARLRGFERGAISPRDVCSGCGSGGGDVVTELGGDFYAVARTDLLVPLFPNSPQFETFVFFDVGSSWGLDTDTAPSGRLEDETIWRNSAGIGASFDTQIGQFEAYFALHTDGTVHDQRQEFGLTFRSQF